MAARLICIYSPLPQMGKSTIANHLVKHHSFRIVKFATPLYHMSRALLWDMGLRGKLLDEHMTGRMKNEPIPGFPNVTMRKLLQTIGTEWGRNSIDINLWTDIAMKRVKLLLAAKLSVVIDDMRFPNEYDACCDMGGRMWRLTSDQRNTLPANEHPSEGLLDDRYFNREVHNNSTLEALRNHVDWELDK